MNTFTTYQESDWMLQNCKKCMVQNIYSLKIHPLSMQLSKCTEFLYMITYLITTTLLYNEEQLINNNLI